MGPWRRPGSDVLILAGVVTAAVLIWRDRTSSGQMMVGGLVLATMVAFSGHDDWLVVFALILVAVAFVQTIWSDTQPARNGPGRLA